MGIDIPDLWPNEGLDLNALSPVTVLRMQATYLRQKTRGLVNAEVDIELVPPSKFEVFYFELIAQAISGYRYRLMTLHNRENHVYPVWIRWDGWGEDEEVECSTESEFIDAVGRVFSAQSTWAVIASFIAKANEQQRQE